MDIIFFGCGEPTLERYTESRRALSLLDQMKKVVATGQKERYLQRSPHLILLDPSFYFSEMKPVLCQWMCLWLSNKNGLSALSDAEMLAYLSEGTQSAGAAAAVHNKVFGDAAKMLNLSRDWICSFLPFVLGKINRVTFGLLSHEDLHRALAADPGMPKSRQLLAVPFVGKVNTHKPTHTHTHTQTHTHTHT
jgi:hypothetical protein